MIAATTKCDYKQNRPRCPHTGTASPRTDIVIPVLLMPVTVGTNDKLLAAYRWSTESLPPLGARRHTAAPAGGLSRAAMLIGP